MFNYAENKEKAIYHIADTIAHKTAVENCFKTLLQNYEKSEKSFINILLGYIDELSREDGWINKTNMETTSNYLKVITMEQFDFIFKPDQESVEEEKEIAIVELAVRMTLHDFSKLAHVEQYLGYRDVVYKLAGLEYGTPEHKQAIAELDAPFELHTSKLDDGDTGLYQNNHHPEYYSNGFKGMNLYDIIEMICDWCGAATCRGFKFRYSSVKKKQQDLGFDDEFYDIIIENVKLMLPAELIQDDL